MRVALFDCDHGNGFPNLALLKLSAYHKVAGDEVIWQMPLEHSLSDRVYVSCVFTWNRHRLPPPSGKLFVTGGMGLRGWRNRKELPAEIEHICPDYDAVSGSVDFSIGFTSRGCDRRCSWCAVSKEEGKIRAHAELGEFLRHDRVRLLDNNILMASNCERVMEDLKRSGAKVDFNQGLDVRLIDRARAEQLYQLKWWRHIRLSFDRVEEKEEILGAIRTLRNAGFRPSRILCYVLVGFPDGEIGDAEERVKILREEGIDIFAMLYQAPDSANRNWAPRRTREFCRWINIRRLFKRFTFDEFLRMRLGIKSDKV